MPNWCYNRMEISGDKEELGRFMSIVRNVPLNEDGSRPQDFILTSLMPMPLALEGSHSPVPESPEPNPNWEVRLMEGAITQEWFDDLCKNQVDRYNAGQALLEQTGYTSWYEWQHDNWGIKWGDCGSRIDSDYNESCDRVSLYFETPWAPFGDKFMTHVSTTFPNLTFVNHITEEANLFAGAERWRNGECTGIEVDVDKIMSSFSSHDGDEDDDAFYERMEDIEFAIHDAVDSAVADLNSIR